jgi:hypothetical protein
MGRTDADALRQVEDADRSGHGVMRRLLATR